jgi:hypothetical protein
MNMNWPNTFVFHSVQHLLHWLKAWMRNLFNYIIDRAFVSIFIWMCFFPTVCT